ncbi:hypothetical protein AVEN_5921-1 [Araneus ventricosus]|uniref:HTH CENPB-type domain-containing protein n=1 Tax=Araneus ventricosus TaxID=182803 RepID=A0A4Y2F0N2_ARAVE|nr:hypothetical protein AVEN_5921-1 [Araneus ventricosus]
MAGVKRKLNVLSIDEKMKILKFLDGNPLMKKSEIVVKFGVPASTFSTIIKNRKVVEHRFLSNKKAIKKVENVLFRIWTNASRNVLRNDQGIPISGQMMQKKAEDFAKELGHGEHFEGSNGWLESFKNRRNIVFRKLCDEGVSVPESMCEEWIKDIPALVKE